MSIVKKTDCYVIDLRELSIRKAKEKIRSEKFKKYIKNALNNNINKEDILKNKKYNNVKNKEELFNEAMLDKNNKPLYFMLPYIKPIKTKKINGFEKLITKCPYCRSTLIIKNGMTTCSGDNLSNIKKTLRITIAQYGITKAEYLLSNPYKRYLEDYFNDGYINCGFIEELEYEKFKI
jgi:hypothetical protein